jgi:hypothetical protein
MLRGGDPFADNLFEFLCRHARVRGRDDLDYGGIAACERILQVALEQ